MTQSLSGYFLRNAGIDLNIPIMSDYCCMNFFLPCGGVSHHSVSHSATSNQFSSPPHLNKSVIVFQNLLIHLEYVLHNRLMI